MLVINSKISLSFTLARQDSLRESQEYRIERQESCLARNMVRTILKRS